MFSLNFRELWSPLSPWLTDELDQMASSAQAKWFAEHDAEGGHGDVTASSLSVLNAAVLSRLALRESRNTSAIETVGGFETIKVVTPAVPATIVSLVPSATDDVTLWSLSTVGRTMGEIVILRAAYDYSLTHFGFVIRSLSSTTPPASAAKFYTPGDGAGTNYDGMTLGVGESLLVRLESAQPTSTTSFGTYWRTLGKLHI